MKMVSSCWRPFVDNCEGGGGGSENHHHHHREGGGGSGGSGGKYEGLLWRKNLGRHSSGEYSMAVVQANSVVEDQSQVESWTLSTGGQQDATFVGVYDGHGGPQASQFVKRNLFYNIKRFSTELQGISDDVLRKAFQATDENFLSAVRKQWQENPSIATTGSCCLAGIISDGVLHTANAGDSRVILGRVDEDTGKITAVQVSKDHNAAMESEREELRRRHPFDHDIVVLRHNVWRVKGMIQVTRSIGDAYLKKSEFNRPPLQAKYRLPKGFTKPILTGEPSVSVRKLSPEDRFLVFASDGLWEHFNNQEVVDIVQTNPRNGIAKRLVQAALKEAAKKREMRYSDLNKIEAGVRRHFHDDITVIVLFLDQIPSYGSSS